MLMMFHIALLTLRVWALYGKGRALTIFLIAVYGGSFAASGAKIYLSLSSLQGMCTPARYPRIILTFPQ